VMVLKRTVTGGLTRLKNDHRTLSRVVGGLVLGPKKGLGATSPFLLFGGQGWIGTPASLSRVRMRTAAVIPCRFACCITA
jgi:hypothetical protein